MSFWIDEREDEVFERIFYLGVFREVIDLPKKHSDVLIVGINGSPNRDGNTAYMLNKALEVCRELGARTDLIICRDALKGMRNQFCIACESPCTGKCIKGKPLEKAFELMAQADGLIIGSPVYFGTVSGQLKAFWDKTRHLRTAKRLLNVVGGVLSVGASMYGGQETTVRAIQDMMLVQGMIVVGDGYVEDDCGHLGAMATRPAAEDSNAMNRVVILSKRVVEVARATKGIRTGRA